MTARTVPTRKLLAQKEADIQTICRRYGVRSLRLFGSVGREESREGSDIDMLVRFGRPVGLLHLVRLERELSELLGVPVDLVTEKALSPYIRSQVLSSARVLYEYS